MIFRRLSGGFRGACLRFVPAADAERHRRRHRRQHLENVVYVLYQLVSFHCGEILPSARSFGTVPAKKLCYIIAQAPAVCKACRKKSRNRNPRPGNQPLDNSGGPWYNAIWRIFRRNSITISIRRKRHGCWKYQRHNSGPKYDGICTHTAAPTAAALRNRVPDPGRFLNVQILTRGVTGLFCPPVFSAP